MGIEEIINNAEEVRKENKKLEEEIESMKEDLENAGNLLNVLEEENKKLKAQIEKMSGIGLVSATPMVIEDYDKLSKDTESYYDLDL